MALALVPVPLHCIYPESGERLCSAEQRRMSDSHPSERQKLHTQMDEEPCLRIDYILSYGAVIIWRYDDPE